MFRGLAGLLTPEQFERYQPWIDNNRRLRDLTHQLGTLSLAAMWACAEYLVGLRWPGVTCV